MFRALHEAIKPPNVMAATSVVLVVVSQAPLSSYPSNDDDAVRPGEAPSRRHD